MTTTCIVLPGGVSVREKGTMERPPTTRRMLLGMPSSKMKEYVDYIATLPTHPLPSGVILKEGDEVEVRLQYQYLANDKWFDCKEAGDYYRDTIKQVAIPIEGAAYVAKAPTQSPCCARADKLCAGSVVMMKRDSGMKGYGNSQCVSWVSHEIGELSLFGHNEHYKTYDVDKILSFPIIESESPCTCDKYREALERIAKWELPVTGKFWDKEKTRPTSYETEYGSNGAREYIKQIADEALK